MNEINTKEANNIGSKIYSDAKTVLHRFVVIILAIGVIGPLALGADGDKAVSLLSIAFYAIYHLTFFRFTKPRF